ncbi:GNAT family N-acetyltransferase [Bifidobacterium cuniculi]|uniref:Acetyltransferase, GNAT family n=1 Tax=Bifidobacterium cuniculi TaxID=1688 RepID=A0A087B523_9BIFI|nr:GNAT family N-acetyltransferase [Bifidobacterium cuniculi]KFI66123.1 acetyltransferase, GNAT family [Bifidobacterium cuniculi]
MSNDIDTHDITPVIGGGIDFRPMRWSDLDAMADCFDRVWPQVPYIDGTPLAALMARYLTLHYVALTSWSNIAALPDGTFAGCTLARIDGQPQQFPQAVDELERVRAQIAADPRGADALAMLEDGFFPNETMLEEDADIASSTQAELELFMVDPDVRGHGLGRELWQSLLAAFAKMDVHAFFLHTDSSCDYSFYDHKGLERVAERLHADHPEDDETSPKIQDDQYIYRGETAQLR